MTALHSTAEVLSLLSSAQPGWLARSWETVRCWKQRTGDRDGLAQLDERMLKDIGMTRADVTVEGDKHFWQR